MFAQIIRGKVSDAKAVDANFNRWSKELAPGAKGWLGTTGGVTDDGQLFIMVRFKSEEAARANSKRPEQDQFWSETSKLFDGEPTVQDSTNVYVDTRGGVNSAGFVQVVHGQLRDAGRGFELMGENASYRKSRSDILGII